MSDDMRRLFEHAGREMRPEFRTRLRELLEDEEAEDRTPDPLGQSDGTVFLVELDRDRRPRHRGWHPGAWLAVAAGLTIFVGLVVAPRASDDPDAPAQSSPVTAAPSPAVAECALVAETLGVVATQTTDIRVGIMPDGQRFCLVDDATGAALAGHDLVNSLAENPSPPTEPTIVESGVADTTAYYFVVEIPEGMPVRSISAPGGQAQSFPTRVGRRLLVIDTDYDLRVAPAHVTHDLNVYSSTGTVLATLVADIGALTATMVEEGP